MTSDDQTLPNDQVVKYVIIGFFIAIFYVFVLSSVFLFIDDEDVETKNFIPSAYAQVQPFELQLEQIRNPEECTRKIIQGASAQIPFTLKIFYDTTTDRKWGVISETKTFPVAQQTAQVATFFTNEVDQYQLFLEINYDNVKKRQAYIELLSEGKVVANWQEKFDDKQLCMNIHINTVLPPTFPTREELIGDLLTNVDMIPEMITSFNINTITWNTSISYMWTLIFGSIVVSVMTLIGSAVVNKNVKSKMRDMDEAINLVDSSAKKIDELHEPLVEILENQDIILQNQKKILEKSPEPIVIPEKKSRLGSIIRGKKKETKVEKPKKSFWDRFRKKSDEEEYDDVYDESEKIVNLGTEQNKILVPVEVVEEKIEVPPKEVKEQNKNLEKVIDQIKEEDTKKDVEDELTGGFIQQEEKVPPTPPPKEEIPALEQKPPKFKEILRGIDFEKGSFKKGMFEHFTYNELNSMYGWIVHYKKRKQMLNEWEKVPQKVRDKQDIAEQIVYHAIFAKMERKNKDE